MDSSALITEYNRMQTEHAEVHGNSISAWNIATERFGLLCVNDVYHYTDTSGFISIMQNQELWASHISFMNDRFEFLHGKELFRNRLIQKISEVSEPEQQVLKNAVKSLDKEISDGFLSISGKDIFSISFSSERDSLEMWRGYGRECGIAIGIDSSRCHSTPGMCLIRKENYERLLDEYEGIAENVCPSRGHRFFPFWVLYDNDKKLDLVDQVIDLSLICFANQRKILNSSDLCATIVASDLLSDLIFRLTPLLKHPGFKGEAECRFVDNHVSYQDTPKIYYRNRGGIVLPYVKYKLLDLNCRPLKEMPISEIIVGPGLKQSKVVDSVKYFCEKNNMGYLVDKIHASDIPYVET